MNSLAGKIVLITGASSGIGEACAHQFAQLGAKLILTARRKEKLDNLAKTLKTLYQTEYLVYPLDVAKHEPVLTFSKALPASWQEVDILINNAGGALGIEKFPNCNIKDSEQMIDTNLKGIIYLTQALLPQMLKRNSGHIVNISSISAHGVYPGGAVYCATKHAVNALSKGLRHDLLGTNIRVSIVSPGMVETEFSLVRFKGDQEKAKKVYEGMVPLHPNDIADAVVYCVTRPPHVNVYEMIVTPTDQVETGSAFRRTSS